MANGACRILPFLLLRTAGRVLNFYYPVSSSHFSYPSTGRGGLDEPWCASEWRFSLCWNAWAWLRYIKLIITRMNVQFASSHSCSFWQYVRKRASGWGEGDREAHYVFMFFFPLAFSQVAFIYAGRKRGLPSGSTVRLTQFLQNARGNEKFLFAGLLLWRRIPKFWRTKHRRGMEAVGGGYWWMRERNTRRQLLILVAWVDNEKGSGLAQLPSCFST